MLFLLSIDPLAEANGPKGVGVTVKVSLVGAFGKIETDSAGVGLKQAKILLLVFVHVETM